MILPKDESARIEAQGFAFIVRGPFTWGKGETEELAMKRAKVNLPKNSGPCEWEIYKCPVTTFVDDYGALHYSREGEKSRGIQKKIEFLREVIR